MVTQGRSDWARAQCPQGRTRMNGRRNALRLAAAALLASLARFSGAAAQSGPPIKVGAGLSLTGGSAPAGKMLQAAIELWRRRQRQGRTAGPAGGVHLL